VAKVSEGDTLWLELGAGPLGRAGLALSPHGVAFVRQGKPYGGACMHLYLYLCLYLCMHLCTHLCLNHVCTLFCAHLLTLTLTLPQARRGAIGPWRARRSAAARQSTCPFTT
jgi:hypothetical protein